MDPSYTFPSVKDIITNDIVIPNDQIIDKTKFDPSDTFGLSGLDNLGNTCYMNATLQCLFATDIFNYYIKCGKFKYDLQNGITQIEINKHKDIIKSNPHISLEELTEFIKGKKSLLKNNFKNSITYSMYQVFTLMWNINCTVKPRKLKFIVRLLRQMWGWL